MLCYKMHIPSLSLFSSQSLLCYVPVLSRPIRKFKLSNVLANPMAGASPIRPAGRTSKPIFI